MSRLFFWTNLLLLIGAVGVGLVAYHRAGGYFSRDVVYVAPRLNESRLFFSAENITGLHEAFPGYLIVPSGRGRAEINHPGRQVSADVVFTDSRYFMLHHMDFITGSAWTGCINDHVIVLNEALAWRLFGGVDVVGLTVFVQERPYVVIGVVRQEPRADGGERALIQLVTETVTALYILPHEHNEVNTPIHVRQMLQWFLFVNPGEYVMVDLNRYVESMGVRVRVLLSLAWLVLGIKLLRTGLTYTTENKKSRMIFLLNNISGMVLLFFVGLGIYDVLQWLPALGGEAVSFFEVFTNIGTLPPEGYMSYGMVRLSGFNRLVNYAWIVGAVGLVNLTTLYNTAYVPVGKTIFLG